jgi:hypothetical protein
MVPTFYSTVLVVRQAPSRQRPRRLSRFSAAEASLYQQGGGLEDIGRMLVAVSPKETGRLVRTLWLYVPGVLVINVMRNALELYQSRRTNPLGEDPSSLVSAFTSRT